MKTNSKLVNVSLFLVLALTACGPGQMFGPSVTPSPTITPTSTATFTPSPTSTSTRTPKPTKTLTPTPAPIGITVRSASYEVTVIKAFELERIYAGGRYGYVANPGHVLIEVHVKVKNLASSMAAISWAQIYIKEENGKVQTPFWGNYKAVDHDVVLDAGSISIPTYLGKSIAFTDSAYLRIVYMIGDHHPSNVRFFFVEDSAPIVIAIP